MDRVVSIKATRFKLTEELESYVMKKLSWLEKLINAYNKNARVFVEVARTTRHHKTGSIYYAELQVMPPGSKRGLRAVAEKNSLYEAVDCAKDELKRELQKEKEKRITNTHKGGEKIKKEMGSVR